MAGKKEAPVEIELLVGWSEGIGLTLTFVRTKQADASHLTRRSPSP
ncbi:hypothetical protein [Nonomuraea diastatica]|nr:hypothetical protein [Nonomuraea diastatica]